MNTLRMASLLAVSVMAVGFGGCAGTDDASVNADDTASSEDAVKKNFFSGENGSVCLHSAYDCKLRPVGGNRVETNDGLDDWGVNTGVTLLDGNGEVLGVTSKSDARLKFNYGLRRSFGGNTYVFTMKTVGTKTSGWFPLSEVLGADSLAAKMGNADAHRSGLTQMGCYEVRDDYNPTHDSADDLYARKRVFRDAVGDDGKPVADTPAGFSVGDYLARFRDPIGRRTVNLAFNTPGDGLGGVAHDHFPAGTRFRRLDVPTKSGHASISIPLYVLASDGHWTKPAGSMRFFYGAIKAKTGEVRNGWLAEDAIKPSSGCPTL